MSTETKIPAVLPGAVPSATAKRIDVPTGPVTGRAGEAILTSAIETALLGSAAPELKPAGAAGEPAPATKPPGDGDVPPVNDDLPPEHAEPPPEGAPALTELSAEEQAEVATRAKANGVTPEEQHAAEVAELTRLEAKAKETGQTVEAVAAAEEAEAAERAGTEKKFSQKEVEELIQKRVKNQATEIAELKRQLAEKPAVPAGNGLLDHVSDPAKLVETETNAQAGLETADDLLSQLGSDPDGVQGQLRQWLGKAADEMDLSPAGMAKILRNAKAQFRETLKAVPQRKAYLDAAAKAEPIAKQVHPWLAEPEDTRTVLFKKFELQMPQLKVNPAWQYWLACAVDRHVQLTAAAAKKPAATAKPGKFVPKVTFPKTASRGGGAAPKPTGNKLAAAKAALAKDPTNAKLQDAVIEAMMG